MDFDPLCVFLSFKVLCLREKPIVKAAFELTSSHVCEKRSNTICGQVLVTNSVTKFTNGYL